MARYRMNDPVSSTNQRHKQRRWPAIDYEDKRNFNRRRASCGEGGEKEKEQRYKQQQPLPPGHAPTSLEPWGLENLSGKRSQSGAEVWSIPGKRVSALALTSPGKDPCSFSLAFIPWLALNNPVATTMLKSSCYGSGSWWLILVDLSPMTAIWT